MPGTLRSLLPRTHAAFLGRFERPTEIQREAIPAVLERADVLLCAPTASGKTEAYAAPAAETQLASERKPMSVLFVGPTRALANDLARRLAPRMREVGLTFGRYTGEHKERTAGALPEVAVTTPEALDSLLARRAPQLRDVHTVVLDEIHVLDNGPRGDQLRVLLHRLERNAARRPQRVAASATVEDPPGLAARYLADARVFAVDSTRKLTWKPFAGRTPDAMRAHLDELAAAGLRKVLVFCNRRDEVELLAAELAGTTRFEERVYAHHGSLSQAQRERTERLFLEAAAGVAVATMTLELGIDIGSVDYVLLSGPPPSVSSLMQRLGRGGRRAGASRVGVACTDAAEELVARTMLASGARGSFFEHPYAFRPGVLAQQALVLAGGRGWVGARELEEAIPPELRADLGRGGAREILDALVERGLLEPPRSGRHVLDARAESRYERGLLHGNLAEEAGLELVDRLTGEVVGRIEQSDGRGSRVGLGGAGRRIVRESEGRLLTDRAGASEPARYRARSGPLASLGLARAVAEALGAAPDEILQVPVGPSWRVVHGLGTLGGLLLAELTGATTKPSAFTLALPRPLAELPRPDEARIERFLARHAAALARLCAMGPYHHDLPERLQRAALRRASGVDRAADFLRGARLRTLATDAEPHPALVDL